jgi:hypothetical protein
MPVFLKLDDKCHVVDYYISSTPIDVGHVELPSQYDIRTVDINKNGDAFTFTSNVSKISSLRNHDLGYIRAMRNNILKETDKYTNVDYPHKNGKDLQAWLDYRQALRDLPISIQNDTDLNSLNWPKWGQCDFAARPKIFTGQQTCSVSDDTAEEGMVVCANQNKYGDKGVTCSNAITINESTPNVSLSSTAMDKSCFGVISRTFGHKHAFINSLGEGAMWVVNTAGPLESGDYITTSNVAGYGQRQDDDILHNYTVAKITMDCDFNPPDIPVQRILKELSNITYWYQLEDATSDAYDRTEEETYYTLDRRVEVHGHVDEQSNVFVEPVHDLELYTRTQQNVITEEVYNALPEDERVLYDSNTFTYTQVTELVPEVWADLDGEEQNTYVRDYFNIVTDEVPSETPGAVECTRTVYKKIVNETKVEPATPEDYLSEVRQEWVNVLDAHGQLQWEDVPWGETEPAYKVRYLDADGKITTRHNEVHRAAFVGVTYHCG